MKKLPCILLGALAAAAACDSSDTHLTGTPDADSSADSDATADADADATACDPACAPGFVCVHGSCVPVGADADADSSTDADADADADSDADADAGPDCLATCTNDPPAGSAGTPCETAADCAAGFECFPEQANVFDGELYVYWPGGYCASYGAGSAACNPYDPRTCPSGSECIYMGAGLGGDAYGCMDRCAAASREDVPWNDNCDCRDGYACDLSSELCLSGCSNDRECCEVWDDRNGNGIRNTGEVTLLGPAECTDVCDPCSFTCTLDGCPGGTCTMGGPCEHDSDCPADAQCWIDPSIPGGMCVRMRCDLVGRECPAGSGCADLGGGGTPYYACMTPCTPGTQPGDPGYPCRDVDPAGPSAGDSACQPTDPGSWYDATDAGGYCYPGHFPGGDGPLGSPCASNDDCLSPFGLGLCADWETSPWCTVMCSEETAADGLCEIDPSATNATGACYYQICVAACDTPAGPLGANGCSNPDLACYDSRPFSPYLYLADGRTRPPGICYAACTSDAECLASWGAGYACDDASGTCQP